MPKPGSYSKKTLLAINDLERLGANPIEMLKAVYDRAIQAFDNHRGDGEKSDAGPGYLAVARSAAADLASYKHPKLSAMAFQDMSSMGNDERKSLTTADAINIIKSDKFAPKEVQSIDTARVVESMESTIQVPSLPTGDNT